jgi:histidine triad (HIT) family protein
MSAAYDENNIFAKILRGEAASVKVFEDGCSLAFMDVMPRTPGHVLIIPKVAARNIFDIPPAHLAEIMPSLHKVALAVRKAMACDGMSIQQFNEAAGGQVVFHLHFHILPRWEGVALKPPGGPIEKPEVLQAQAAKIIAALEAA